MTHRCLIVDDEELARKLIAAHLRQLPDFELVGSCENALEAGAILQKERIDLLFLDIEMPLLKGTDFYGSLLEKPRVIFTTAYRDYAVEGFNLNAVDYLLKPVVFGRFFKSVQKYLALCQQPQSLAGPLPEETPAEEWFFVNINKRRVRILQDSILYVESLKDYVSIHTTERDYRVKQGLTAFAKKVDDRFLRIHRSYLVNRDKITAYTRQDVEIGEIELPIGKNYRAKLPLEL